MTVPTTSLLGKFHPIQPAKRPYTKRVVNIHEVYPYLRVSDTAAAIEFYKRAFDAQELYRLSEPDGRVGHAEIKVGNTVIMLSDEYPESGITGPKTLGGTTFSMHLHVDNVDALMQQAIDAGATVIRELKNEFYGERGGKILDPFGHEWMLGQQIEQVTPEEMQRRYSAMFA